MAADIIHLLDALGVTSKVHLVGHDIGGMIVKHSGRAEGSDEVEVAGRCSGDDLVAGVGGEADRGLASRS